MFAVITPCLFLPPQILRVLGESAIAVRTKAMKCLSEVVAVDPSILARVSSLWSSGRGLVSEFL